MRLLAPVRSWVLLLALVATGDAVALSRAMWAEFNAIYLVNLKPTADCSPYRARSLDLLKDGSIAPDELDARMRALWREAKPSCLQPLRDLVRAAAPTTAAPVTEATAARVAPPTPPQVAAAPASAPSESTVPGAPALRAPAAAGAAPEGVAARAAEEAPPPAPAIVVAGAPSTPAAAADFGARTPASPPILPDTARAPLARVKPPIERPALADLRLEAACAKRNPYAYQVQSDDDPCVRLARSRAAAAEASAAPTVQGPAAVTTAAIALVVIAMASGAALWVVRRRRLRRDATPPIAATASCGTDHPDGAVVATDAPWSGRVPA